MNQDSEWDEPKQPQRPRTIFGALLFPANRTGLAHIGIYTVCLMLLGLVRSVMIGILGIGVSFINLIVAIEMVNYLRYCLRQSACGAVTAPDSLLIDSFDVGGVSATLGGYFSLVAEYLAMIIPVLICFLPAILYSVLTERLDLIFIILLAAGIFYFPILLMAAVIFDSSSGYNPLLHIMSIIKTFFSYCILVLQTAFVIVGCIGVIFLFQNALLAAVFLLPIQIYLIMVMMHLLGRFYYLHQHQLNWEV